MKAVLMLEDGKSFIGVAQGSLGERIGELICNTAVVGYQEMITDPANAGKILVLTYPLIGNYGCAPKFNESKKVWLAGLVIKQKTRIYSNWQAKESFDAFLKRNNLFTLTEVDTRTLTVHLRHKGETLGIISTSCFDTKELLAKISAFRKNKINTSLAEISVKRPLTVGKAKGKKIALLDLGVTQGLLRQLELLGLSVLLLPYNTSAQEILRLRPKGLVISNGPEQAQELDAVATNISPLIGKLPVLGIGTGHQVLAQALGAKVIKMKLGHRGVNYPIHNAASYKGEITAQNHGHVVDTDSLNKIKDIKITGYNLNDRTVEEIESKKRKILGVQYLPVCLGFDQTSPALKRFTKML